MFRFLVPLAAVSLLSTAAIAADLPAYEPPPEAAAAPVAYDWTGFYVGAQGGWLFGDSTQTDTAGATTGAYDIDGGLIGGEIGANWQWNWAVLGVEGDIAWADVNGSTTTLCAGSCFTDIDAFATARARLGVAFDRFLVYGTGGAAFAKIKAGQTGIAPEADEWTTGWTAGGGIEVGITPHLSAKVEALFVDLDDVNYTVAIPVNVETDSLVVARGGINFRF